MMMGRGNYLFQAMEVGRQRHKEDVLNPEGCFLHSVSLSHMHTFRKYCKHLLRGRITRGGLLSLGTLHTHDSKQGTGCKRDLLGFGPLQLHGRALEAPYPPWKHSSLPATAALS